MQECNKAISIFNDFQNYIDKFLVEQKQYLLDSEHRLLIEDQNLFIVDTKENILLQLTTKKSQNLLLGFIPIQYDKYFYCFCNQQKYIAIYRYQLKSSCPNKLKVFDLKTKKFIVTIIDCAKIEENVFMMEFLDDKVIIFYDKTFRFYLLSGYNYTKIFKFMFWKYQLTNGIIFNKSIILEGLMTENSNQLLVFYRFANEKLLKLIYSRMERIEYILKLNSNLFICQKQYQNIFFLVLRCSFGKILRNIKLSFQVSSLGNYSIKQNNIYLFYKNGYCVISLCQGYSKYYEFLGNEISSNQPKSLQNKFWQFQPIYCDILLDQYLNIQEKTNIREQLVRKIR